MFNELIFKCHATSSLKKVARINTDVAVSQYISYRVTVYFKVFSYCPLTWQIESLVKVEYMQGLVSSLRLNIYIYI